MEYRRIKDQGSLTQDKNEDAVDIDLESTNGKPLSDVSLGNADTLSGSFSDMSKWKRKVITKRAGKYDYSVTTANFLVEALMCDLSLAALGRIWRNKGVNDDKRMLLTAVVSVFLFDFHLSLAFFLGSTVVSVSIYMHSIGKLQR